MDKIAVVEVPEFLEEDGEYDTQYKRTVRWDMEAGDFVRDGANKVQGCAGEEGFQSWCYKTAMTERYAVEIGAEMEEAMDDDEADIVESQVERTITEAIGVNPRTEWVGDFEFIWDADVMHCTFYVKGVGFDELFQVII